jgi:hypothetical protein
MNQPILTLVKKQFDAHQICMLLIILTFCFYATPSSAQWSTNPAINNAITTAVDDQFAIAAIPDGDGGAIIAWADRRSGATNDIYAQRIDEEGNVLWIANGVPICTAADNQYSPQIIADDSGGAYITWYDRRSGVDNDIYAQHINASGIIQWSADGLAICMATDNQYYPTIASDGNHGAIITWEDRRTAVGYDIYAQRVNSVGTLLWSSDGVAVCAASNDQNKPKIISDGTGGAIINWVDKRAGVDDDIYAQRINIAGIPQWTTDGVAICAAVGNQGYCNMVSDAGGGAIITWQDLRIGSNPNIFAQRIDATGIVQWSADGVAICAATGDQQVPVISKDLAGGATIAWVDYRTPSNTDIFAQRIDAAGVVQWTADGIAICGERLNQFSVAIMSDASGGAIITWRDLRNTTNYDVYTQRVNTMGITQWTTDGVLVAAANGNQNSPVIVSDEVRGAIITWLDYRAGSTADIFAQHIGPDGNLCTNPIVNLGADVSQCGGTFLLDAGNTGLTFLWNNDSTVQAFTATTSGKYYVAVTDSNGCIGADTLSLKINDFPIVIYNELDSVVCSQEAPIALTQGSPVGGTYTGIGVSGNIFNQSVAGMGNFNVVYSFTDSNGCASLDSSSIEVVICEGIHENKTEAIFQVFPNPSTGIFTIQTDKTSQSHIDIYNELGLKLFSSTVTENQTIIDLSAYNNGFYFVQLTHEKGSVMAVQKMVITK